MLYPDLRYFGFKTQTSLDYNLLLIEKCEKAIKQIEKGFTLDSSESDYYI